MTQSQRPRVWLHIGMPKTGSSALQTVLFDKKKLLRSHGYLYPDFSNRKRLRARDKQHVAMARMLARRAGSTAKFPKVGGYPPQHRFVDYLAAEAPDCHSVILSTEYLFQRPGGAPGMKCISLDEGMKTLTKTAEYTRDYLAGMDVNIVVWLRRQDRWLMSMYNQTIKTSLYREDFSKFAKNTIGVNLYSIVSIWINLFGRDRVHCFSYDSLIAERRDIVQEFANVIGIDAALLSDDRDDVQKQRNAGLSLEALELKRMINQRLSALSYDARREGNIGPLRKLVARVSEASADWPHAMLSPEERLELMSPYMEGNAKLVDQLGYSELSDLNDLSDLQALGESSAWKPLSGSDQKATIRQLASFAVSQVERRIWESRFSQDQIVAMFKAAEEGRAVDDVCREHDISKATYLDWKNKFGGMETTELMKRLRVLEVENQRLKRRLWPSLLKWLRG